MKPILHLVLFCALMLSASAQESAYQKSLQSIHDRFAKLETERSDYRKPKQELPPEQEREWLQLMGQLITEDPFWLLQKQLYAEIRVLADMQKRTAEEDAVLDMLKDFLAVASSVRDFAANREEATLNANTFRRFMVRRDLDGAQKWSNSLKR
jgi:hypothetical protein